MPTFPTTAVAVKSPTATIADFGEAIMDASHAGDARALRNYAAEAERLRDLALSALARLEVAS